MNEKEDFWNYADGEFLVWLEDHINYIRVFADKLDGALSVYKEYKKENPEGFGWVPTTEYIDKMNAVKTSLDHLLYQILAHHRVIVTGKDYMGLMQEAVGHEGSTNVTEEPQNYIG